MSDNLEIEIDVIETEIMVLWRLFMKRWQSANIVSMLWNSIHEACYYYAIPYRNRYYRPREQQGEFKASRIYDTTAVEATKVFVSNLQDSMTPTQTQWAFLEIDETFNTLEDEERNKIQQVLDNYMRKLFVFIHQSNFDVVINECYFDLAIGTSCLVINSYTDQDPLMFTSIPMDKLALEEAMTGRVESWYRTWENVKVSELKIRWPKAMLTVDMENQLKGDPDAVVEMLHEGVMYMPGRKKPYLYMVGSKPHPIFMEEFETNPGVVWRFQKVNNEVYGRGPIMDALPSIISLNELARIELAAANLNTFKPYMGFSDAVFNPHTFKLEPFTVIPIAPIGSGGTAPLIPLGDSSNPQFSQLTIQDLRMQVKALLYNEIPQTNTKQPLTATEAMIDQQNFAKRIGPLFSRLQQEFLWPVVKRCAYILDKMGLLPYPELEGIRVRFKYKSPLALAKGQQDVARFTQYMQLMQGMMGPEAAMGLINPGIAPYLIANQLQVDMRYLNDPEMVKQAAQAQQDQQDDLAEAALQEQLAGAQPPQGAPA